MDRSEIMEIRKLLNYSEGNMATGQFCGCFVNTKHEIKGRFSEKFVSKKKEEMHKYLDIFKKVLPNNASSVTFSSEDKGKDGCQFFLEKLRETQLKEKSLTDICFERIAPLLPEKNYVILIMNYFYDVPVKTKDKLKIDDASSETYKFIICAVCPVKTAKGSLGYQPDTEHIGENPQQMVIEKPAFGFLYPEFNNRSTDTGSVLCSVTEDLDISKAFFGHEAPMGPAPEKKTRAKKASSEPDAAPAGHEIVLNNSGGGIINRTPVETAKSSTAHIPSLDTGTLSNDASYVPEKLIMDDAPASTPKSAGPSDADIIASSGSSGPTVKRKPRSVRISGDRSKIKKETIRGITYYLIPVEDSEISD